VAQPGPGWHFPLEGEAACLPLEGDPERPFILGALKPGPPEGTGTAWGPGTGRLRLDARGAALRTGGASLALQAGDLLARVRGEARFSTDGDLEAFTGGLRLDATLGMRTTTSLLQSVDVALGPRWEILPGDASRCAFHASSWVLGTEDAWARAMAYAGPHLRITASARPCQPGTLLRTLMALGAAAAATAGGPNASLVLALLSPLGGVLGHLATLGLGRPGPDISLVMDRDLPLYLGSLFGRAPSNFLSMGASRPFLTTASGRVDAAARMGGWQELEDGGVRPSIILASERSAFVMGTHQAVPGEGPGIFPFARIFHRMQDGFRPSLALNGQGISLAAPHGPPPPAAPPEDIPLQDLTDGYRCVCDRDLVLARDDGEILVLSGPAVRLSAGPPQATATLGSDAGTGVVRLAAQGSTVLLRPQGVRFQGRGHLRLHLLGGRVRCGRLG
jgi:hypothetical protein